MYEKSQFVNNHNNENANIISNKSTTKFNELTNIFRAEFLNPSYLNPLLRYRDFCCLISIDTHTYIYIYVQERTLEEIINLLFLYIFIFINKNYSKLFPFHFKF